MGLLILIAGLALFLGVHTLTTLRGPRAKVIARLGEGGYKILYTLVSFAGLALIAWGFSVYRATGWINVWYPPVALRHLVLALMLPAVILVVASWREAVGASAPSCQWRSRIDHPVRLDTGLGGL